MTAESNEALVERVKDGIQGDEDDPTSYVQNAYFALDTLASRLKAYEDGAAYKLAWEWRQIAETAEARLKACEEALREAMPFLQEISVTSDDQGWQTWASQAHAIHEGFARLAPPDTTPQEEA